MGKFIAIEGMDGTGKSTIIERLKIDLPQGKFTFLKDPGSTAIGDKIRSIILDSKNSGMSPITELFLFTASRAQMVQDLLKPAITKGHVISDRFSLSTMVYQDSVKNFGDMKAVVEFGLKDVTPDLIILLDVLPEVSFNRISKIRTFDRMESKGRDYFEITRIKYLEYAKSSHNVQLIDASGSPEEVYGKVLQLVKSMCGEV